MSKRKRRLLALGALIAACLTAAAILIPGGSADAAAATQICDIPSPVTVNCIRDPGNGGSGTAIVMAGRTSGPTENWQLRSDPEFCNNHGTVQSGCGLPSFLVNRYHGHSVVVWRHVTSAHCLKIENMSPGPGDAFMGTCYDANTILIIGSCASSKCYYVSISQSEVVGQILWICAPARGKQPYAGAGPNCDASHWEYVSS